VEFFLPTAVRNSSGDQRNYGDNVKRGRSGAGNAGSAKAPISMIKRSDAAPDSAREKKLVKFSQLYLPRNRSRKKQPRNYSSMRATCKRSDGANVDSDMAQYLAYIEALRLEREISGVDFVTVIDRMFENQMVHLEFHQVIALQDQFRELNARIKNQAAAMKESARAHKRILSMFLTRQKDTM